MSDFAYWLTPSGKIIKPELRHISTVIKYPKKFGETEETIAATYEKYQEQISSTVEGKAREEILLRIINRGFVRIRKGGTRRNEHWSIQVYKLNSKLQDAIWQWANRITNDGTADDKYADVVIHQFGRGDKMTRTSLNKIASGVGIKESIVENRRVLEEAEAMSIRVYDYTEMDLIKDWKEYCRDLSFYELSEQAQIEVLALKMKE